jgi:hypothetical protein
MRLLVLGVFLNHSDFLETPGYIHVTRTLDLKVMTHVVGGVLKSKVCCINIRISDRDAPSLCEGNSNVYRCQAYQLKCWVRYG